MGLEQLADLLGHRDGASEPGLGAVRVPSE